MGIENNWEQYLDDDLKRKHIKINEEKLDFDDIINYHDEFIKLLAKAKDELSKLKNTIQLNYNKTDDKHKKKLIEMTKRAKQYMENIDSMIKGSSLFTLVKNMK